MLTRSRAAFACLAVVAAIALAGCGSDSDTATGPACDYPSAGQAAKDVDPPPAHAAESGEVDLTMTTSAGDIGLTLDADAAPCTVNSFVSLTKQGYFDSTTCHRLTIAPSIIFVLQCGDPTGTGSGGPGYTIADEVTGHETYPAGTLAMAKTPDPDSGGSQFFIVYDDTQLDPDYTVFGKVDAAGLKVVRDVAAQGTVDGGPDGAPKTPVDIESITVD
jgi:peptidyl-prolyl cis-trans isomerase B (cyclophilin B)